MGGLDHYLAINRALNTNGVIRDLTALKEQEEERLETIKNNQP